MNTFLKQLQRGKLFTAFLALLLTLAIALLSISASAWQSIRVQMSGINQGYTTIAVPLLMEQSDDSYSTDQDFAVCAQEAPQLLSVDRRCLLSAYTEGRRAMSSGALDALQYVYEYDLYNYNLTVMAVKCISVEERKTELETTDGGSMILKGNSSSFEIIDAVSRLESYDLPYADDVQIDIGNSIFRKDGQVPFEEGKTYLIRGFYQDFSILAAVDEDASKDSNGWVLKKYRADPTQERGEDWHFFYLDWGDMRFREDVPHFKIGYEHGQDGSASYSYFPEEGLPFYAEYSGDWRDFLNTPEGKVWRDEIIPMCERNQHSAAVILTDSLQSIYAFNTGTASVLEGREFAPEEYTGGSRVCMVSASYALLNDLQVGDTLSLDLYNSGYAVEHFYQSDGLFGKEGNTVCRLPMVEENRMGVKQDYTIVGIYSAPEYIMGVHNFHADTIFVPKASVPNAQAYEDPYSDYLNTYILENGAADEFEAYMAENGYGGSFAYFDQDFGEIVEALESLRSNAQRLLALGVLAFALAAALFIFLSLRRMAPAARGMRLMGVKSGVVWRELAAALGALVCVSAVLGGLLGAALYGFITEKVLSSAVVLRPGMLALCALAGAVMLIAAVALCALPLAHRKLMQTSRAGKK